MKHLSKLIPALLLASSLSVAYAQTPGQRPMTPPSQAPQGGQMMGGGMQGMQNTMGKMQEQMAKIRSTSDPAERQKLMLEHMSAMREAMGTMMKTGGPGTGMMPGGGMMAGSAAPPASEVPGRMGMMEQRMGMMQMMMDQMIQHQQMMDRRQ